MSDPEDARAYLQTLRAIGASGHDAMAHQRRLASERARKLGAAETELSDVRAKRQRIHEQLDRLRERLDHVPPSVEGGSGPARDVGSLDELITVLDGSFADVDAIEKDLAAARSGRAAQRRLLISALLVVAVPVAVLLLGGGSVLAGAGAVIVAATFIHLRVDRNPKVFIVGGLLGFLVVAIASYGWAWWQVLIGASVVWIFFRIVRAIVIKIRSIIGI